MPVGRRQQLLQWARRQRSWVIEDDYDGEFRYGQRPIEALQVLDTDSRVIYVGTFSKALSPQLRLGYLVLPPELVPLFREAKRMTDRHAPVLEQRVLAALIEEGVYERHIRRMRRKNEQRRAALLAGVQRYLPADAKVTGAAAGLHLVLWLPSLTSAQEFSLIEVARSNGIGVYPMSPLFGKPSTRNSTDRPAGLVLGYASLSEQQILSGMQQLGTAIVELAASAIHRRPPRPCSPSQPRNS